MSALFILVLLSLAVALVFLVIFIISAKNGQFDDVETPGMRMLFENEVPIDKKDKPGSQENETTENKTS